MGANLAGAAPRQNVLVLYSDSRLLPANIAIGERLAAAFDKPPYCFFTEFLDVTRFPTEKYPEQLVRFLETKYASHTPDVIIAAGPGALAFLSQHRRTLFRHSPIVFCATDTVKKDANWPPDTGGITGVRIGLQEAILPTINLARELHPTRSHLYVVGGVAPVDQSWKKRVQAVEPELTQQGMQFTYLNGLELSELKKRLAQLPPNAIVLFTSYFSDTPGNAYTPRDVVKAVAEDCSAPIYAAYSTYIGIGSVGGVVTEFDTMADLAVQMVERIFRGEKAETIPPVTPAGSPVLDARQLERWGVSYARTPPGATIRFLQPNVFEQYRLQILGAGGMFAGQSALVAALLIQGRRRRRAESALRFKDEFFRAVVENAPDILMVLTPEGKVVYDGPSVLRVLGYTYQERLGSSPFDRVHPDDRQAARGAFERALSSQGQVIGPVLYRYRHKDGHWLTLEAFGRLATDETGSQPVVVINARDITDRQQAEEESRREHEFSDTAIDSLPGIFYVFDGQGNYLRWNRNFEDATGYSAEEIRCMKPVEFIAQCDRQMIMERIQQVFTLGEAQAESHLLCKDERTIPYFFTGRLFLFEGKPCLVGMGIDISDRRRAELALLKSEARMRLATDAAGMGFWSLETDEWVLHVSPRVRALLGQNHLAQEEYLPYDVFLGTIHPEDRARLDTALRSALAEGTECDLECRVVLPDEEIGWIAIKGHRVMDLPGDAEQAAPWNRIDGVLFDVTERRVAEEAAHKQRAEMARIMRLAAMGEMAASIAHEVNQPLAAAMANASACLRWLGNDTPNVEEAQQAAMRIVRDGRQASEVIRRVRSLFQPGNGIERPVRLSTLVSDVLSLSLVMFSEKGIEARSDVEPNLPLVLGDPVQLRQMLINLIVNAAEAMVEGSALQPRQLSVTLRALVTPETDEREPPSAVRTSLLVSVRDTGPGLDAADLTRIFDAFVTSKPDGTGLGLSICRSIVEVHRGRIWAERNTDGPGMTFHISLPAAQGVQEEKQLVGTRFNKQASDNNLPYAQRSEDSGSLVLIVDDDEAVCEALAALLRSEGISSLTFPSAEAFLEAEKPDRPVCAILDVRMPGRSGLALFDEMHTQGIEIPTLFLTGHGDIPTTVHAMKAGAGEFLTKPFSDGELLRAVRHLMDQAQETWAAHVADEALRSRYEQLSLREREVMALIVTGMLNKHVATQLGIMEGTAKVHRSRVMEKMEADSFAELVRMADRLGIPKE